MSVSRAQMGFEEFRARVRYRLGFDLTSYKPTQLQRRLETFMARQKMSGYEEYFRLLASDARLLDELIDYLTINVTEFFRDVAAWQMLKSEVLPRIDAYGPLRTWSAACSNGAEPYSLGIIIDELKLKARPIQATDINREVLDAALTGRYSMSLCKNVEPDRLDKYFTKAEDTVEVAAAIRKMVAFRRHDLLKDPTGSGYHLIVCRNVQIYFTREAQLRLNRMFTSALVRGGVLFIGASESILDYQALGLQRLAPCFYLKT